MAGIDGAARIGNTQQFLDGVDVDTTAGLALFREGVAVSDPVVGEARSRVVNTQPTADLYGQVVRPITAEVGVWGYTSGISGTASVTGRILQISATTGDNPATFTINNGSTITIPANQHLTVEPKGNLVDPTVTFSGTSSYFIEYVG